MDGLVKPAHARPDGRQPAVFSLYGEPLGESGLENLHIEDIDARARLYDWKITPHAHADMTQLIYVHEGGAEATIEDRRIGMGPRSIICIPDGVVHGFEFEAATLGWVLSVERRLLDSAGFAAARMLWRQNGFRAAALSLDEVQGHEVSVLFRRLHDEFSNARTGRDVMLDCLTCSLLVLLLRDLPHETERNGDAPDSARLLSDYRDLVNQRFRDHWPVSQYAQRLSVSQSRLVRACRAQTGKSPMAIINARLLLEAQRNLRYTEAAAARIALDLGFQDPAYFSRFFKKMAGLTPRQYRRQSRYREEG